jgi:hypothetical protein
MEKFEYFPIKCRIQRAANAFQKSRDDARKEVAEENGDEENVRPIKTKVHRHSISTASHGRCLL